MSQSLWWSKPLQIAIKLASPVHKAYLRDLLSKYLSELERYGEVNHDYRYFDAYWEEPAGRWPYLIERNGGGVGFAFVNKWSPSGRGTDFAMAEFYINPEARASGVGLRAVEAILQAHLGSWELSIASLNTPAQDFWPHAIGAVGARNIEQIKSDGATIYRFLIEKRHAA
jgi:predicted acetyltransferase